MRSSVSSLSSSVCNFSLTPLVGLVDKSTINLSAMTYGVCRRCRVSYWLLPTAHCSLTSRLALLVQCVFDCLAHQLGRRKRVEALKVSDDSTIPGNDEALRNHRCATHKIH